MRVNKIIISVAAVVALAAGFRFGQLGDEKSAPVIKIQGYVLETPRKIGVPELQQDNGNAFTKQDLTGHWSLLFYGYTHCPDICPTTLNSVAAAKQKFHGQSEYFPQVIFISVDPKRDDVELIGEYVRYFDEDFIGVTGEEKMLQAMAMQMSVVALAVPSDKPEEYLVDHSSNLMLLNPDAELVAMLRPPHTADGILKSLNSIRVAR